MLAGFLLLEGERPAFCNRAEIAFKLVAAHADSVVNNCKRAVFPIDG